ncbi:redoxin domain-containing protein [Candidatus Gracilibacteria bacterium]|nr:redoxin domain-containing protein [Candidatus Gracilibacteria bacterium]
MENLITLKLEDKVQDLSFDIYEPSSDSIIKKNLNDFAGKWLVLFFYPADFTFVCPTELKDLNKSYEDIKGTNAEILVVSTDTVFSHKRWIETEKLLENFGIQMVSDRKGDISRMFGVLNSESGNSERGTFIISPDGELKAIEIVTEPIGRSTNELVRKIRALEFVRSNPGQACPATWNVGGQTLKPSIKIAGHVGEEMSN